MTLLPPTTRCRVLYPNTCLHLGINVLLSPGTCDPADSPAGHQVVSVGLCLASDTNDSDSSNQLHTVLPQVSTPTKLALG